MHSESGFSGESFNCPFLSPAKGALLITRAVVESSASRYSSRTGFGAQAPQCDLVMSSTGGLPGAGAVVTPGPFANLVFSLAVFAYVVF